LLVHLLGAGEAPRGAVDPSLVDELASWHGMEAALGEGAPAHDDRVEPALRAEWKHASLAAFEESVWRFERVRRVMQALAPLPVVVFKGFAYAELIYPSPGGRLMGDVDLLIAPEQVAEAVRRLTELGFTAEWPVDLAHAYEFEWTFKRANLALDVHRGFSFPARLRVDVADVVARAIPWAGLGSNARLLSPEDALLVQALQAPLAELSPVAAPAMGAWDLRLMLRRAGPFWGKVASPMLDRALVRQRAEEWGASRMLYAGLRWMGTLFPDSVPAAEGLLPELSPRLRHAIDASVVAPACPPKMVSASKMERMRRRWLLVRPADRVAVLRQMVERWANGVGRSSG
jgi:hypothetical protein